MLNFSYGKQRVCVEDGCRGKALQGLLKVILCNHLVVKGVFSFIINVLFIFLTWRMYANITHLTRNYF